MNAGQQNIKSDLAKGALAGAIGVFGMDFLVTDPMYRLEDQDAYRQEKKAQVGGKWVAQAAVLKLSQSAGIELSERQNFLIGQVLHYLLGVAPGALYAVSRRRFPAVTKGKGLLYGLGLFIMNDEIMGPAAGIASGPRKYPWQAHVRGLLGHLMLGAATHVALEAIEGRLRSSKPGANRISGQVPDWELAA